MILWTKGTWWTVIEPFEHHNRIYEINDLFVEGMYGWGIFDLYDRKYSIVGQYYREEVEIILSHCRKLTEEELMIKDILQ